MPFIIVICMALPATTARGGDEGHQQRRPDHQGHRLPVEVGLRLPARARARASASCRRSTRRSARCPTPASPQGDDYLLQGRQPAGRAGGQKVRIITTANDVIHAWMVPAFGVKQDAIPGFVRDTWFRAEKTGDFYGQCAELCGKEHAYMPIHVKVLSRRPTTAPGSTASRRRWRRQADDPTKVWTLADLVGARREGLRRQLRGLPPGQRQGRRPDQAARRLAGRARRRQEQADPRRAATAQNNGAMPSWKQLSRHRASRP